MEFALDPNGDGRIRDRVDIINMSLGSTYGQPFDDDLSLAVDNAAKVGVLTVASAGNSADKQFITGSPAAASSALSVAQTAVPSSHAAAHDAARAGHGQSRRGVPALVAAAHDHHRRAGVLSGRWHGKRESAARTRRAPTSVSPPGELAGRIVLVDRGTCSFSLKIANIAAAGGILGIIGLITPEAPFARRVRRRRADDSGLHDQPGRRERAAHRSGVVRFSPTNHVSLAGSLASTSSRGPRFDDNIVKPEIGAPGASISANSGSFTATSAFGGTSGAAPMVTGAAAILKAARPFLSAREIKQLLINTAETEVLPAVVGSIGVAGSARADHAYRRW